MNTNQIYTVVNEINSQTMGEQAIRAVDTNSFVAMGQQVLSSSVYTEAFINTLVQRIGRTIIQARAYTSKLSDLAFTDIEWGAIMQKIKVDMPSAVEDKSVDLVDGQSVDQWIIAKPQAHQKFFVIRSPYDFYVTIQTRWLKEAFLNETTMNSFIGAVFTECRNKMELSQENLARMCIANFIANVGESQTIHLLTNYTTATGDSSVTADTALTTPAFLRYAIAQLKYYSIRLEEMSTLYNKEGITRFTPLNKQRVATRADFKIALETEVEYAAYHENYLKVASDVSVAYWQNAQTPNSIIIQGDPEEGSEEPTTIEVDNILALIHDRDALGTFRKETEVLTTPVNARGAYYNTFWHCNDARFNDMSENGLLFLLD